MVGGGSALYQDSKSFPDLLPAFTDIRLNVELVTEEMGVWAAFEILLVDETLFEDSFISSTQPSSPAG